MSASEEFCLSRAIQMFALLLLLLLNLLLCNFLWHFMHNHTYKLYAVLHGFLQPANWFYEI